MYNFPKLTYQRLIVKLDSWKRQFEWFWGTKNCIENWF